MSLDLAAIFAAGLLTFAFRGEERGRLVGAQDVVAVRAALESVSPQLCAVRSAGDAAGRGRRGG